MIANCVRHLSYQRDADFDEMVVAQAAARGRGTGFVQTDEIDCGSG